MSWKRDDPIFFPPVRVYECLIYTVCTTADPDDRVSNYDFAFSGFGIKAKLIKKFISQNNIKPHLIDAEHIKGVD